MERTTEVPEYRIRLPDHAIASLLGISLDDYNALNHLPLQAVRDDNGEIIQFFIRISTNNNARLLEKLRMDEHYSIKFSPKEVYSMYV